MTYKQETIKHFHSNGGLLKVDKVVNRKPIDGSYKKTVNQTEWAIDRLIDAELGGGVSEFEQLATDIYELDRLR